MSTPRPSSSPSSPTRSPGSSQNPQTPTTPPPSIISRWLHVDLPNTYLRACERLQSSTVTKAKALVEEPQIVPFLRTYFLAWYSFVGIILALVFTLLSLLTGAVTAKFTITLFFFQKIVGVLFVLSHLSIYVQIMALIGSEGVLPAEETMHQRRRTASALQNYLNFPTLCWISTTDEFLTLKCWVGLVSAGAFTLGYLPNLSAFISTVVLLSWKEIGVKFFQLQFDVLIVEIGYSAMLIFPFEGDSSHCIQGLYSYIELFIIWLLVVRLHIGSGSCKILSGDPTWNNGTALTWHYYTTPIPNFMGWYAHQMPLLLHFINTNAHFVIELFAVLLLFIPTNFTRVLAFVAIATLQVVIIVTGNFGNFNYLTIAAALTFLDDSVYPSFVTSYFAPRAASLTPVSDYSLTGLMLTILALIHLAIVSYLSLPILWKFFNAHSDENSRTIEKFVQKSRLRHPNGREKALPYVHNLSIANYYGVFAVMTTSRNEILIEGYHEGRSEWIPYELKYKPGRLDRAPPFIWPGHLPRLDWFLWFASLRYASWTRMVSLRLLQGSQQIQDVFESNPFPDSPPTFIRMTLYSYTFASPGTKARTGKWWDRVELRPYDKTFRLAANGTQLIADSPGHSPRHRSFSSSSDSY